MRGSLYMLDPRKRNFQKNIELVSLGMRFRPRFALEPFPSRGGGGGVDQDFDLSLGQEGRPRFCLMSLGSN